MKKYSYLILVLALLLTGCITKLNNKAFDWAGHSCVFTGDYDAPGFLSTSNYPPEYTGTFRCTNPDGSNLTCPNTNQPAERAEFQARVTFPRDITDKNFLTYIGCNASSASTTTPTSTPRPTATSTPMPTATPSALLTGDVTACSLNDSFINFKLVTISPLINEGDVNLTINGTQVSCSFAGSDISVLSCPLPAGVSFPAQINVAISGTSTDAFSYDGSGCTSAPVTNPSDDEGNEDNEDNEGNPAPTPCLGDVCS